MKKNPIIGKGSKNKEKSIILLAIFIKEDNIKNRYDKRRKRMVI